MLGKVEICGVNTTKLPTLTAAETDALLHRAKDGDAAAREKLVEGNLRLVLSVIQRFSGRGENADDLFQVGCVGLLKAIDNFDTSQNVRFSTYGVPMIIGEIRRYLRDNSSIRVSRSMRDTAYRVLQAREKLQRKQQREPTVEQIARELGIRREEVVFAMDAVCDPVSLFEPIYSDGGEGTKLYSTAGTKFKKLCIQNKLNLLDASVRHLGTDVNLVVLSNLYDLLKDKADFYFDSPVTTIAREGEGYRVTVGETDYTCDKCIVSVGRVGSKWMEGVCQELKIPTKSNRVDIGVRVEIPAVVFSHLTDELYESKIVYRTEKFEDNVRTFCMNPNGIVVNENTNGIVTVNGHSYEDKSLQTENTNFALLVAKHFSEPFKDSNGYGESIARLSNMLGGGVIVQRFGDLVRGRRSTVKRIEEGLVTPTLAATPGDLSLVLPKRILDGIIEMIYALDKIAPGTANDDTLLYGVEVKFYNMEVALDEHLETPYKGLYVIGDGSGITHSLSHASASGVYVAREILETV